MNLLADLRQDDGLTYLFVSHDLRVVAQICGRVACMCAGRIVELGPTATVLARPVHPYTRALVSAVPTGDPDRPRRRIEWDPGQLDRRACLREVADGHWTAM